MISKIHVCLRENKTHYNKGKSMTIRGESFDLIREKQELDIFLSSITGAPLSHGVLREKPGAIKKGQEKLPGADRDDPFNLAREKEEVDAFLSGITMPRLPDEVIAEAMAETIKEQQPVAVQKAIVSTVSDDDVSTHKEPESKGSVDEDKIITDRIEREVLSATAGGEEQQIIRKEEKPAEKSLGPIGIKVEKQPQPTDRGIKDKTAVVKGRKKGLWSARIRTIGLFVVFIIITQSYLWLHPNAGHQAIEWMRTHIPLVDQLLGEEKGERNIIINQIEFINVKQRIVQNESLGNLMIIEGTVVNQADFPVAKVKVMGELLDSSGRLLAARVSYCGNILSDEALGRLQEEDIRTRSSISREDKIIPKGQMPFMIVFKWKQADGAKATVTAVEAERISP